MEGQTKLNLQGPDLIEYAISNTPPEELNTTEQLWREIYLPNTSEIIHNPAICLSKICKGGTLIKPDQYGHFHEYIEIDGQQYDIDNDLIQWMVAGRGTLRHDPRFMSQVIACGDDLEHYTRATPKHCKRITCPNCTHYTNLHDSVKQAMKVCTKAKELRHTAGWKSAHLQHVAVSVPPTLWPLALTPEGKKKLDSMVLKISQKAGILGGIRIFHPFRYGDDDDIPPEGWAPEDGQRFATFSPHYHIIGFGFIDNRADSVTAEIEKTTGWVVKALRTGKRSITKLSEVQAVIFYIKTHAGVPDDRHGAQLGRRYQSVVPFGLCAPNSQSLVATIDIYTPQICPECGAPLVKHLVHGANGDTSEAGTLDARVKYPIYAPRNKANELRAFLRDNNGDIVGALQYLDRHPFEGTSFLSHTQFSGLVAPLSIKCLDGSLHCVEPYAILKIHDKKSKKGPVSGNELHDLQGLVESCNDVQHNDLSEASGRVPVNDPEMYADIEVPFIDYYLPPEVLDYDT